MFKVKTNPAGLAKALYPGIASLVGAELDKLIEEHIDQIRRELIGRIKHTVNMRMEDILNETGVVIEVDCRVNVKED